MYLTFTYQKHIFDITLTEELKVEVLIKSEWLQFQNDTDGDRKNISVKAIMFL